MWKGSKMGRYWIVDAEIDLQDPDPDPLKASASHTRRSGVQNSIITEFMVLDLLDAINVSIGFVRYCVGLPI